MCAINFLDEGRAAIGMARIPYPRGIEIAGDFNAGASE